jgi:hypothetical protein
MYCTRNTRNQKNNFHHRLTSQRRDPSDYFFALIHYIPEVCYCIFTEFIYLPIIFILCDLTF